MNISKVLVFILCLTLIFSVTACDNSSNESSEDNSKEVDPASLAGTTINVYTHMGQRVLGEEKKDEDGNTYRDEDTAILKHLAEKFEKEYDITVNLEVVSNEDDLKPLFQVEDSSVDIFTSPNWSIEEWQKYAEPYFTLEEGKKEYGEYATTMYNDGEQIYALSPAKSYENSIVYNEEVIKSVGYDEIPSTLDEFEEMCEKIKDEGVTPISLHRVENWPLDTLKTVADYMSGENDSFSKMLKSDTPFSEEEPIGAAIKKYTEWKANGYFEPEVYTDFGIAMDSVAYGKAGMMLFGSWVVPQIQGRVPEGKDSSIIKFAPAPDFGNGRFVLAKAADSYAICKFSENKAAARLFIEYIAQDAQYIADSGFIANKEGVEPIIPDLYSTIDDAVNNGEAELMFEAPTTDNKINNEEVLIEANLNADYKWAGNLFDSLDVTKPDDWSKYDKQVDAQNKAYSEAKEDLGITWED
jgi:ABC-type glycerol-3-phosphate transport system substrate-binding protein